MTSHYDVTQKSPKNNDDTFQSMPEEKVAVSWYIVERGYHEVLLLS